MAKFWKWLNGNKTMIGVVATVVLSILHRRGIDVPDWTFDITDGILGLGLAHKVLKVATPAKAAVASLMALVLAGCTTAAPEAPQPASAPVNQAGSPVVVNVNIRASDVKTETTKQTDASGAVSTKAGVQDAAATSTPNIAPNVSVVPK